VKSPEKKEKSTFLSSTNLSSEREIAIEKEVVSEILYFNTF
jgi:hypothetical protein